MTSAVETVEGRRSVEGRARRGCVTDLNVRSAIFVARAAAKGLIAAKLPGSIINVSSQMGHVGGPGRTVYCATKHALEGATKAMAWELGAHGIRVNTICPTFIETPMTAGMLADSEFRSFVTSKIALGRVGRVLGYEAKERSLVINKPEAETVRTIFQLYLEHGKVRRVKAEADRLNLATKIRKTGNGRMRGGRLLSRGYIYKLLGNPLYAGRIAHKGEVYEGQHEAIIDAETWEAVQSRLAGNAHDRRSGRGAAEPSLLSGLLHDERGNRLSPSHAVKNGVRYRYYVSQALLQHRDGDAGSIVRIPAREIEALIAARITALLKDAGQVIDELGGSLAPRDQKRLIAAAGIQAELWPRMAVSEQRSFILHVVAGVTVGGEDILTSFSLSAATMQPY